MAGPVFGVVVFPGSNCDRDAHDALGRVLGAQVRFLWHKDSSLGDVDVIVLPGGFSYGDYLRCGAIARFSPIMKEVIPFAKRGGIVLGICNGFQILCEAGLLPGALLRNQDLRFVCRSVSLRVENASSVFTRDCVEGEVLRIPIAHGAGNYTADDAVIRRLEEERRVVLRYCEAGGGVTAGSNPNGSRNNIAGIINAEGNVMGLMPHPERATDPALGSTDGQKIFRSLIDNALQTEEAGSTASLEERN